MTFKISSPQIEIDSPSIFYFVNAEEENVEFIILLKPEDGEEIKISSNSFEYKEITNSNYCLINYYSEEGEKPIFSAFLKNTKYSIPEEVQQKYFSIGKKYLWEVLCFDFEDKILGRSKINSFIFKK